MDDTSQLAEGAVEDDEEEGGFHALHPESPVLPILVATSTGRGKNTLRLELTPIACWKLNDLRFALGSSFLLPRTRQEFSRLLRLRKDNPGAPLSVFGHADPVGNDAFNKKLSGNRAEAIYAVLVRETALWETLYTSAGANEGWGLNSLRTMLETLGYEPGPPSEGTDEETKQAIGKFQSASDLSVDGTAGPQTRKKLFLKYMDYLCAETLSKSEFLGRGEDPKGRVDYQGCGEFNPLLVFSNAETTELSRAENRVKRNLQNSVNRRVVVLFFRPGTYVRAAKWPCPASNDGIGECQKRLWSDGDWRRSPQELRREFRTTANTFGCRFYHRLTVDSPCEGIHVVSPFVYRAVILMGGEEGDGTSKLAGPMVLEARDGSYKSVQRLEDATRDGRHLVFEFQVENGEKEYDCYMADQPKKFRWRAIPKRPVALSGGED
jgi:outer membrane protein OmpA-like peptidoglycan-associated protein